MTDIEQTVIAEVRQRIDGAMLRNVTLDTGLRDIGVHPLDPPGIACALDERFGIEIPDKDLERWEIVGDVAASVARLVEAKMEGASL